MNRTEHAAEAGPAKAGPLATLAGLLRDRGSSAPSARTALALFAPALLATAGLLLAALPAQALPNACPQNEAIREAQHSTFLPDCRAYEQVSPAEKDGGVGNVFPLGSLVPSPQSGLSMQSSPSGEGIVYQGEDFSQSHLGNVRNHYLSLRGPGGWSAQNLTPGLPPESLNDSNLDVGFSPDLSQGILDSLDSLSPPEGEPEGYPNLYLSQGAGLRPLLTESPPNRTTDVLGHNTNTFGFATNRGVQPALLFAAGNTGTEAVPAFTRLLFEANDALTPAAIDGGEDANNLYEFSAGALHLVNVLPDGHTEPAASFGVEYGDEYHGGHILPSLSHVISADGSRIFWTDPNNGNLYLRRNADREQSALSAGECTEPALACTVLIAAGAAYRDASADGSLVFYTKGERLYRYDVVTRETADLSSAGEGGGVLGFVGASADGSSAYFVSSAVLTGTEQNHQGNPATAGKPNLYLSREGATTLVATLSPEDNELPPVTGTNRVTGDWYRTFAGRTAEVSPDGRYLAFVSIEGLTGYDNTDAARGTKDSELFLYDSQTGELACPSCNADGSRPTNYGTSVPAPENATYQQRYLFDNGRLFFSTADPVLPQDNGGQSVYEYEDGHLSLISPLTAEAVFADAAAAGNDVFFTTSQQLVPADRDQNVDLYDARLGGGFQEEAEAIPCAAEACRGPLSPPPASQTAGSGAPFTPPLPLTCRKGFVLRRGACLRLHRHSKKHHVRHERNKGKKHKHRAKHHRKGSVRP